MACTKALSSSLKRFAVSGPEIGRIERRRSPLERAVFELTRLSRTLSLSALSEHNASPQKRRYQAVPYLLVRHKVTDFSTWEAAYDAHLSARQKAGLKQEHLLRISTIQMR